MSKQTTYGIAAGVGVIAGLAAFVIHGRQEISRAKAANTVSEAADPDRAGAARSGRDATSNSAEGAELKPAGVSGGDSERLPGSSKKAGAIAEANSPLRAGETWDFSANISKLSNVANLRLRVIEKRNFFGKSAWHLQAIAHTENPLRMMFALDDQFDSYSDVNSLVSMQYEMHLNEKGQSVESVQRMTTTGKDPAPADAVVTRVVPGTRDPLGLMQYLRTVDWSRTQEVRSPVYDGHKLYDVRAKVQSMGEAVTVPAGSFRTFKIGLRVLDNGTELKDASFTLYLANNETRTPVLLEAVMPFATARVELVKVQ
jgi:hypothetical protein